MAVRKRPRRTDSKRAKKPGAAGKKSKTAKLARLIPSQLDSPPWIKVPGPSRRFLLPANRVLITGGWSSTTGAMPAAVLSRTADVYDPATNRFSAVGQMAAARAYHISLSAGLVNDHQVLVAGGYGALGTSGNFGDLSSAEIFANDSFHPISDLQAPRASAAAEKLDTGRILITGGQSSMSSGSVSLNSAEYLAPVSATDPASYAFVPSAGAMTLARTGHTATRFRDNNRAAILVVGGTGADDSSYNTAEVYIQANDGFGGPPPISMIMGRTKHAAALLGDGRILVCGGSRGPLGTDLELSQAELFDPATYEFSATGAMHEPRQGHTATPLADGRILVVGGTKQASSPSGPVTVLLSLAEIFDPVTGKFTLSAPLRTLRTLHTATPLGDGRVLIVGGRGLGAGPASVLDSGEIFDPSGGGSFTPVANPMSNTRVNHSAAAFW